MNKGECNVCYAAELGSVVCRIAGWSIRIGIYRDRKVAAAASCSKRYYVGSGSSGCTGPGKFML